MPPIRRCTRRLSADGRALLRTRRDVCASLSAKDHLNLFVYDGAIAPDPDGIITGGHNNSTARTIAFRAPTAGGS